MSDKLNFKVNIMDRDFTVACEDGDQDNLLAAAANVARLAVLGLQPTPGGWAVTG